MTRGKGEEKAGQDPDRSRCVDISVAGNSVYGFTFELHNLCLDGADLTFQ